SSWSSRFRPGLVQEACRSPDRGERGLAAVTVLFFAFVLFATRRAATGKPALARSLSRIARRCECSACLRPSSPRARASLAPWHGVSWVEGKPALARSLYKAEDRGSLRGLRARKARPLTAVTA